MLSTIFLLLAAFVFGWAAFVDTAWHFGGRGGGLEILLVPLGLLLWVLSILAGGTPSIKVFRRKRQET